MLGVDVSENNELVDFGAVRNWGYGFAIIRLGYGNGHLDSNFYNNVNAALNAGLKIGVYYYSYALNEDMAGVEADFVIKTLQDCGLTADKLEMGIWYDMEDADGYKAERMSFTPQLITNMCSVFVNEMWRAGYDRAGVYANLDWFTNYIYPDQLSCNKWCAQYADACDFSDAFMWQFTDSADIGGKQFDANELLKEW